MNSILIQVTQSFIFAEIVFSHAKMRVILPQEKAFG